MRMRIYGSQTPAPTLPHSKTKDKNKRNEVKKIISLSGLIAYK